MSPNAFILNRPPMIPKHKQIEAGKEAEEVKAEQVNETRTDKPKKQGGNIDKEKLKQAIADGHTLADSAKLAGSKAKTAGALASVAKNTIARDQELAQDIKQALEEKRIMVLGAITKEKVRKASAPQLVVMTGILTDKIQLVSGLPTERIKGDIKFNEMKPEEVKQFLIDKLLSGGK